MIDLLKLAEELSGLVDHDNIFFLKTEPEISNFTRPFDGTLSIYGSKRRVTVKIPSEIEGMKNVFNQLKNSVFASGMTTIFWNVKNLISFFKFHKLGDISLASKVVDLKLVESFLGIKQDIPTSLGEALKRLSPYIANEEAKTIHNKIHKPLALQVIPHMETYSGVIDVDIKKYVYPSYEIEGQIFGRLNCYRSFDNCLTPHNMGIDRKELLKLKNEKDCFVYFDFNHMEVSMLQWLTGDEVLKQVMDNNEDLYCGIYQEIFGQVCDTDEKREMIKSLFLPIMFGQSPSGLVKEFNISNQTAVQIHCLIKDRFKTSWEYMESNYELAKTSSVVKDHFGRTRLFTDKPSSVRGFLVQASSAVFCQEKLIDLHHSAVNNCSNLVYSIHDGYVLVANQENLSKVIIDGIKTLQNESKMCKNLKLKVSCSIGTRLSQMKKIITNKGKNGNN